VFDAGTLLALLAALAAGLGARSKGAAALWVSAALALGALVARVATGAASPAALPSVLLASACGAAVFAARSPLGWRALASLVAGSLALGGLGVGWSTPLAASAGSFAHAAAGLLLPGLGGAATARLVCTSASPDRLVFATAALLAPMSPAGMGLATAPGGATWVLGGTGDAATVLRSAPLELDPPELGAVLTVAQGVALLSIFVLLLRGPALSPRAHRTLAVAAPLLFAAAVVWAVVDALHVWNGAPVTPRPASDLLLSGEVGRAVAALEVRAGAIASIDIGRAALTLARAGLAALALWPAPRDPLAEQPAARGPERIYALLGLALVLTGLSGAFVARDTWGSAWALDPRSLSAGAALLLCIGAARAAGSPSPPGGRWLPLAALLAVWWALVGAQLGWSLPSWHSPL